MNRKNLLALICVVMVAVQGVYAQCTIDPSNTTQGISPSTVPCINQGTAYDQSVQLLVPSTFDFNGVPVPVDSVLITSITGQPVGINLLVNPVSPKAIPGGGRGCIEIAGTTNAAVASYPLTINITAWVNFGGQSIPQQVTMADLGYNFALDVCAGTPAETCDTLTNINFETDVAYVYTYTNNGGYVSGNNSNNDMAIAEKFTASTAGRKVIGAAIAFAVATSSNQTSTVGVRVWDATGTGGTPGNQLDSIIVPLSAIATLVANNPFVYFPFNEPLVAGTDFFVSIDIPQGAGDTIVLYTDSFRLAPYGRGYVQFSDESWNTYADAAGAPSTLALGNYIQVIACPESAIPATPPVANFTGTNLTACGTSLAVQFTDQSLNNPTSWAWSFGDGGTATTQDPSHTYTTPGTYSVTLIATNADGSDTVTRNNYVTLKAAVTATAVAVNADCGQTNGSVTVTPGGGNGTFTYVWSGSNNTTANLTAVGPGTYNVTVSSNGCSATASATVANANSTLAASAVSTPATSATNNDGTATVSATGGTTPYAYEWSNGLTTPTAIDLAPGTYSVTVTDANGCEASASVTVTFNVSISDAKGGFTFTVMPNPATTQLRFQFTNELQAEGYVFGTDGKLYETFTINNQVETLNIADLPAGIYVIQVKDRTSNASSFTRVIKY